MGSSTSYKPGQSGNPGGKPKGARNRVTTAYLNAIADEFDASGKAAIKNVVREDPEAFLRLINSLLPKVVETKNETRLEVGNVELSSTDSLIKQFTAL